MKPLFIFIARHPHTRKRKGGLVVDDKGAPLMTMDETKLDKQRAVARRLARRHKMEITLVRFDQGEILEVIE